MSLKRMTAEFMGEVQSVELPRGNIPYANERVCALYFNPYRPDQPDYVWSMRRRNVKNWTRSLGKHGFVLRGIVREKRHEG